MTWIDDAYLCAIVLATLAAVQGVIFNSFRWHKPENASNMRWVGKKVTMEAESCPSLTLLVPARHEQAVLASTLQQLCKQDYPNLVVMPIIGHDDPETLSAAEAIKYLYPDTVKIVIDHSWPKNKPKALNTALPSINTDLIGIIDAEDDVAPGLCELVANEFLADPSIDVVQGGVHLVNLDGPWYSGRNAVEYLLWYASRLPFQAELGFLPLGGNTCFFRTSKVREIGGWDPNALAEDADIGIRIACGGAKVIVRYQGELATREECPPTTRSLLKQRTRWYQGFIQIIRKRDWRGLSVPHQALALVTLFTPFLQVFSSILLPGFMIVIGILEAVPVDLVLGAFIPLFVELVALILEFDSMHRLRKLAGDRIGVRDMVLLVLTVVPYQLIMGSALVAALWRELRGKRGWVKTEHSGLHRTEPEYIDLRDNKLEIFSPEYFPAAGK